MPKRKLVRYFHVYQYLRICMLRFLRQFKFIFRLNKQARLPYFNNLYLQRYFSVMENDSQSKEFPKRTFAEAITEDVDNGKADAKDNDLDDEKIAPNEVDPLRVCLQGLDPYSDRKSVV